jgi:hypothetical protein
LIRRLKRLGDDLGFDHDCAVLREILIRAPTRSLSGTRILCLKLTAEQRRLRRQARTLSRNIFQKKPREFSKAALR